MTAGKHVRETRRIGADIAAGQKDRLFRAGSKPSCHSPKLDRRAILDFSSARAAALGLIDGPVLSLLITVLSAAGSTLQGRGALALENLALRQQLGVLQRRRPRSRL